jgi:hypothetical protein
VSSAAPHARLLLDAARERLRPLGLVQRGRSRTWLDDRGWWVGVASFGPSSFARGTYLDVGVHWLWQDEDDVSFDVLDPRDSVGFVPYESDEQFAPHAASLAERAAAVVVEYRRRFPTVESAAEHLVRSDTFLDCLDAGIALGLLGDTSGSRSMFQRYTAWFESDEESEWRDEIDEVRYERARLLNALADARDRFAERIAADVRRCRAALKLDPDVPLPF